MKSDNPSEEVVTPSRKKLKQARLPFKSISDKTDLLDSSVSRKRKLSSQYNEEVTKIGKLSKENDSENVTDLVVISDDEKEDLSSFKGEVVPFNPLYKLVDNARKKKLQKTKNKKSDRRNKKIDLTSVETPGLKGDDCVVIESTAKEDQIENMDIDEQTSAQSNIDAEDVIESDKKSVTQDKVQTNSLPEDTDKEKTNKIFTEPVEIIHESNMPQDIESGLIKTSIDSVNITEENQSSQNTAECLKSIEVTPKRSQRIRKTTTESTEIVTDENSSSDSKVDESVNSSTSMSTPKRDTRSSSLTNSQDGNVSNTILTPKQLQKKLDSAKKKEEKEREKQDREKKRLQEKEERARLKQEKEDQKKKERDEKEEQKRKEKEEKEEQRRKEKEEKEKQKELEKKWKEEKEEQKRKEREEKEEQRKKEKELREEERRKKQEALDQEKQEQDLKKKKAAEAFVNFFVPKQKVEKDPPEAGTMSKNSILSNFTIKVDMRLAPIVRCQINEERKNQLDSLFVNQNESLLYLKALKQKMVKPGSCGKTWPLTDDGEDDLVIVEDELQPLEGGSEMISCESAIRERLKPKLFSFHENRRPPYWGTWRKKSAFIKPRRPLGQDEKLLDYEVDSDEDWEEEEGESIDGSRAGSDEEPVDNDEYEVDNDFFVPHGYLSDEEATMDEDDVLSLSPEAQKAKLKYLETEFETEMKKPTEKLKPRLYGLLWETNEGGKPEKCVDALWDYFCKLSMIMDDPTPLLQPSKEPEETEKKKVRRKKTQVESERASPKGEKKKKKKQDNKEPKTPKVENIKESKKTQTGLNNFLKKLKSS